MVREGLVRSHTSTVLFPLCDRRTGPDMLCLVRPTRRYRTSTGMITAQTRNDRGQWLARNPHSRWSRHLRVGNLSSASTCNWPQFAETSRHSRSVSIRALSRSRVPLQTLQDRIPRNTPYCPGATPRRPWPLHRPSVYTLHLFLSEAHSLLDSNRELLL